MHRLGHFRTRACSPIHGQTRRARNRDSQPTGRRARPRRSIFSDPVGRRRQYGQRVCRLPLAAGRRPHARRSTSAEVQNGGSDRRWPAAYELSRLMADPKVRADRTLGPALVKAFERRRRRRSAGAAVSGAGDRPPRSAAAARSRRGPDRRARSIRTARRASAPSGRWARPAIRRSSRSSQPLYASPDAGIRKMVVYALGALPGRRAARDAADRARRTDARRALERGGRAGAPRQHEGVPVLRQMLDRAVRRADGQADVRQDEDIDPIADVMISGLRAAAALKDDALKAIGRRA